MKLLPFRQYSEIDIVNQFALQGTGEAGTLVAVSNGDFDSQHGFNWTNTPGAAFERVSNFTYQTNTTVRPTVSGDTKYNTLGFTLYNVFTEDENGEKYLYNKQKRTDNMVIRSGDAMNVLTKGLVTLVSGQAYKGTPAVGNVIIPSDTLVGGVDVKAVGSVANKDQIIGKVIGVSAKHGGNIMVLFNTAA